MRVGISGRHNRFNIAWLFIFTAIFVIVLYAMCRMHNAFINSAKAYANNVATTAISNSVNKVFSSLSDNEFSNIIRNNDTMFFDTDTSKINLVNSYLTDELQNELLAADLNTVYIPLGTISGIAVLSGAGPKLPVKINPISKVDTDFDEKFESCGINQVRHSISIIVHMKVAYTGFGFSEEEDVKVSVPVTDTVIVGDTPYYYGSGNIGMNADNKENIQNKNSVNTKVK